MIINWKKPLCSLGFYINKYFRAKWLISRIILREWIFLCRNAAGDGGAEVAACLVLYLNLIHCMALRPDPQFKTSEDHRGKKLKTVGRPYPNIGPTPTTWGKTWTHNWLDPSRGSWSRWSWASLAGPLRARDRQVSKRVPYLLSLKYQSPGICLNGRPRARLSQNSWESCPGLPRKHKTLNQCWVNVGLTSWTAGQHWLDISSMLDPFPANARHFHNICTMLDQHRRHVEQMVRVFAGPYPANTRHWPEWWCVNAGPASQTLDQYWINIMCVLGYHSTIAQFPSNT